MPMAHPKTKETSHDAQGSTSSHNGDPGTVRIHKTVHVTFKVLSVRLTFYPDSEEQHNLKAGQHVQGRLQRLNPQYQVIRASHR